MNSKIYLQYDSRWGNLPYPSKYSTVATDGCGLLSVTHCAIELYKYRDKTPVYFHPFMKKWAAEGNGTYRDGITAGLREYLGNCTEHYTMKSLWDELSKGNRVGVIYFGEDYRGPDGTLWTTGGHYQAFADYKVKNGKHWLYMKDSGSRHHDGWYCYEDSMKGCIPDRIWSAVKTGWMKDTTGWYYIDSNGVKIVNKWAQDGNGWFLADSKGYMIKSKWVKDKGEWYYLKADGYMATSEWVKDSKGWCYLNSKGKMVKTCWVKHKEKWYYVDSNGHMVSKKWIKDKDKWYYLNSDGIMMASSWLKYNGVWYYFASDGHMVCSDWVQYKNKWYYLNSDGIMVTGTVTINGKKHKFDSNGKWLGEVKG